MHGTTQINLRSIMVGEGNQIPETIYRDYQAIYIKYEKKVIYRARMTSKPMAWVGVEINKMSTRKIVGDGNAPKLDFSDGYTTL